MAKKYEISEEQIREIQQARKDNSKRKTTYRLTNPIESARMKESLAESMGFS